MAAAASNSRKRRRKRVEAATMKMMTLAGLLLAMSASAQEQKPAAMPKTAQELDAQTARFAQVPITVDLSKLPANEQQALAKLIEAGDGIGGVVLPCPGGGADVGQQPA